MDFFGRGFRVGLSGGTRGRRQQAQVVFAAGKRGFSVVFRARGRCQLDHVVFAAGKQGGGTFLYVSCREDFVSRIMLSSQEHLYMGIVVQGKCWETRGQRQGGHIVFIARLWTFVGGGGRFVEGVGVRSTGFGRNRVLRDWNLFILLGFEGAKCRI